MDVTMSGEGEVGHLRSLSGGAEEGTTVDSTKVLTIIWLLMLVAFLVAPCCWTKKRRKIWRTRFRERRWNVFVEEDPPEDWFIVALERYRAAVAAAEANEQANRGTDTVHHLSWEEEEKILRQLLREEKLIGFTTTLGKDNFIGAVVEQTSPNAYAAADGQSSVRDGWKNTSGASDYAHESTCRAQDGGKNGLDVDELSEVVSEDAMVEGTDATVDLDPEVALQTSDEMMGNACKVKLPPPGVASVHGSSIDISPDDVCGSSSSSEGGSEGLLFTDEAAVASTASIADQEREVPDGCAICICGFECGDRVCWSSNRDCPHVFHERCITNWLLVLGRRRRQRMIREDENVADDTSDLANFPMLCPCCRQAFVIATVPHVVPATARVEPIDNLPA